MFRLQQFLLYHCRQDFPGLRQGKEVVFDFLLKHGAPSTENVVLGWLGNLPRLEEPLLHLNIPAGTHYYV
jgi:hypothetical protein